MRCSGGGPLRRIRLEIHDGKPSIRPQRRFQFGKVSNAVVDVVVRVDNKNEVHWLGKIGALGARQYRNQHAQIIMVRALTMLSSSGSQVFVVANGLTVNS